LLFVRYPGEQMIVEALTPDQRQPRIEKEAKKQGYSYSWPSLIR